MQKRTLLGLIFIGSPIFIALGVFIIIMIRGPEGDGLAPFILILMAGLEILLCCPSTLLIISGAKKSKGIKRVDEENPDFSGFVSGTRVKPRKSPKRGSNEPKAKKQKKQKKEKKSSGDVEFTF